ncbi:MAG: hypothetical protein IK057_04155 [Clostridia bacterium]|nr:hypothetical protein [Clostridia bacterium]
MKKQAAAYRIENGGKPDLTIYISDEFLEQKCKEIDGFDLGLCEYVYTGSVFYTGLLQFDGFMLHSSAVLMDGNAYLFSASSGVGKSTHTSLWQQAFGKDRAKILNDDKPAIRVEKDGIFAYGTPWSGKTDLNINVRANLAGICFLERGTENKIRRENGGAVLSKLLTQTVRPYDERDMDLLLKSVDTVLSKIPVYTMSCTISEEAAHMAYNAMKPPKAE